jgi:hypothetical protein
MKDLLLRFVVAKGTLQLNEQGLEIGDDLLDKIRQLMNRWENRLTLNNLRLIERYLEGELRILIHTRWHGEEYCAVFYGEDSIRRRYVHIHDWRAHDTGPSGADDHCAPKSCRDGCVKCESGGKQEAVFLSVVKLAQLPKGVCPSFVRFGQIDRVHRVLRHALYFSHTSGFIFVGVAEDRESRESRGNTSVPFDQSANDVVESGSEVLEDFSRAQGNFIGNIFPLPKPKHPLARLRVDLADDFIRARVGFESTDVCFEITDVLFGPFDFYANGFESFIGS